MWLQLESINRNRYVGEKSPPCTTVNLTMEPTPTARQRALPIHGVIALLTATMAWAEPPPEPMLLRPVLLHDGDELHVFAQSPTRKVLASADLLENKDLAKAERLELAACRNESEAVQLVLRPKQDLAQVTLDFGPLTRANSTVPAEAWSWQRVVSVPVPQPTLYYGTGGWETGLIPDPLKAGRPFTAPSGEYSALWVEVNVPLQTQPGRYEGALEVRTGDRALASIPVALTVWDIALPTEPTFATNGHEMSQEPQVLRFLKQRKVTSLKYGAGGLGIGFDRDTGRLSLETGPYKQSLDRAIDEAGIHSVCLPPSLLGSWDQMSKNYLSTGYTVGSDEFWPIFDQYLSQMREFYRQNGWVDNVLFYVVDEIREKRYPLVAKIARRAQEIFPELTVLLTADDMPDNLADALDVWVVPWHFFVTRAEDVRRWDELRARGLRLWCYMNSAYTINADWNPGAMRFFPSVCAKYGFEGVVWWHFSYYRVGGESRDPWAGGLMTQVSEDGKRRLYGGGYLFYPPTEEEPFWHSSLRWENFRQGIDEYEMLQLLRRHWARVRRALGPVALKPAFAADQAVRWWGSLLSEEFRLQTYREDKEYIHRFRQLLAHEIQHLPKPPLALVDLGPDGGWSSTDRTLEVRGVVAAGTRVVIGDQTASVNAEDEPYVFAESYRLKPGTNLISVRLSDGQGRVKILYREVLYEP